MAQRLAAPLIGLFVVFTMLNLAVLLGSIVSRKRSSMVPLVGGLFGALGFFLTPSLRRFAWLPLLLDPVTAVLLLYGLPRHLHESWRTNRLNLLFTYTGYADRREIRLLLYRGQVFTLRQSIDRPPGEAGVVGCSTMGSWRWEGDRLILRIGEEAAVFEPSPTGGSQSIRQGVGFSSYEAAPSLSLAGIELVRGD